MEPQIKDMQYLLSATLKTLQNPTESNDTPKIPQRLKGCDPKQLVEFLMQAYRAIVEKRGMEFKRERRSQRSSNGFMDPNTARRCSSRAR